MSATYAIGMVRVSQRGGRDDDELHSPDNQRARIAELCQDKGWRLRDVLDEGFISGGKGIDHRPVLQAAIERIERGEATVLAVAFRDRLDREPNVRDAVIGRVEQAGGIVWAADSGQDTNGEPTQQFSGTVLAAAGRMIRQQAGKRSRLAVADAVASGVVPFKVTTPGYRPDDDNRLHVLEAEAEVVAEAFGLRASGATVAEVRTFLAEHGIQRSYHGVGHLLRSRIVLGEIHFGDLVNLAAHEPIVDRGVWDAVQRKVIPKGRKPQSERLLSKLEVLRCSGCGSRMVVGTHRQNGRMYPFYKCGRVREDCPQRVTISAEVAERVVVEATKAHLEGTVGLKALRRNVRAARANLAEAEATYARAVQQSLGLDDPAVRDRLLELKAICDSVRADLERIDVGDPEYLVRFLDEDFDDLAVADQRRCIRALIERAVVHPAVKGGRPEDRIAVALWSGPDMLTGRSPRLPADLS